MPSAPPGDRRPPGFELHWPADALAEPFDARHDQPALAQHTLPPPLAADVGEPSATLAAVGARVQELSNTTVTFADAIEERLRDSAERVVKAVAHHAARQARVVRTRDRAIAGMATELATTTGLLEDVAASVARLVDQVGGFRSDVATSADAMAADLHSLVRRTPVRARRDLDGDELESVVASVASALRADDGDGKKRRGS